MIGYMTDEDDAKYVCDINNRSQPSVMGTDFKPYFHYAGAMELELDIRV